MSEPREKLDISDLKDTFLECPVCVEHFNQTDRRPRLLHSCLHSFCTQCLDQLLVKEGKGQITCPLCRRVQKVTKKADTLPLDPVRGKLVEYVQIKHQEKVLCTDCPDESEAEARCHECHIYLCTMCKHAHKRNKITRKHDIVSLEEMLNEPIKNMMGHYCSHHPDHKIEFYCSQCEELCCLSCTVVKHKGHDLKAVQEAAREKISDLESQIAHLSITEDEIRKKHTWILETTAKEEQKLVSSTTSINKQFDDVIHLLNTRRSSLLSHLKFTSEEIVGSLHKESQATEDTLAVMDSVKEYFEHMKSKSDDCEILTAVAGLHQTLNIVNSERSDHQYQMTLSFQFPQENIKQIKSLISSLGQIEKIQGDLEGHWKESTERNSKADQNCVSPRSETRDERRAAPRRSASLTRDRLQRSSEEEDYYEILRNYESEILRREDILNREETETTPPKVTSHRHRFCTGIKLFSKERPYSAGSTTGNSSRKKAGTSSKYQASSMPDMKYGVGKQTDSMSFKTRPGIGRGVSSLRGISGPTTATGNASSTDVKKDNSNEDCLQRIRLHQPPILTTSDQNTCSFCMDDIKNPYTLDKCGHVFCKPCIRQAFDNKPVCPVCGKVYGEVKGDQPKGGKMTHTIHTNMAVPGFRDARGTIVIEYSFPSGYQEAHHPNPGKRYSGMIQRAYLPNNREGRDVLRLLERAFEAGVTFTVGESSTTGQQGVITWGDIHHKTSLTGGPTNFGYPDGGYLKRVKEELADKGITE